MARGRGRSPAASGLVSIEALRRRVEGDAPRIAALGEWPPWIAPASLVERIPSGSGRAGGFDAGIACALGMIPLSRQRLAARLHAAYTPEAVDQVRREAPAMPADCETTWWLAACSVCREGEVDEQAFLEQVSAFTAVAGDPAARRAAALAEHAAMLRRFTIEGGLPVAHEDGGMQGAYLAGHPVAAMWAEAAGLWFIGTYRPSLGLEDFPWAEPPDPSSDDPARRQGRSGPVHGSRQFIKCADQAELERVVGHLRSAGRLTAC